MGGAAELRVMTGTVLVTGGTSGIGRETVRGLAERGWTVLVHGRDRERGADVCEAVRAETAGDATFYGADLADFDAVRDLAAAVRDEHDHLDALVNNAGTWQGERRLIEATGARSDGTRDGIDLTVAVNHCGHYLLTWGLWPLLSAAGGRVVTVTSGLYRRGDIDTDRFVGPDGPTGQQAYADSKLANVAFTGALARRTETVTAACCHPGVVPSSRLARDSAGFSRLVWKSFGLAFGLLPFGPIDSPREGAATSIRLVADAETSDDGWYFASGERRRAAGDIVDRDDQDHLWEWTADAVGVAPDWPPATAPRTGE